MKNIQEILLKCGGKGKLVLGDEEIDISVAEINSKMRSLEGYINADGTTKKGEMFIFTSLEVCLFGDDYRRAKEIE